MGRKRRHPVLGETGVTLDGLPFDQASGAQRIRTSVAIGGALNPGLRATLIKDGSGVDKDSLALLTQEAEKADLQVILETISTTGDGILIVDGEVEGAAPRMETVEFSHAENDE
jgi:hypothetical protein